MIGKYIVATIAIVVAALVITTGAAQKKPGPLSGWAVIIDPGHGGKDPGANGVFDGKKVYEASYTYDIALRVKRMVAEQGGIPLLTITDRVKENNGPAQSLFPFFGSARFTLGGGIVEARTRGLNKRLDYGNQKDREYAMFKKAWISIHFDKLGKNTEIEGIRIIAPTVNLRLAKSIAKAFGDVHRLRAEDAVIANGDRRHGLRRLYILGERNHITQKVLIEMGNFNNSHDMWRIRAFNVRDAWAATIVKGIAQF